MKIEAFKHEGVKPDGTFVNKLGAVNTTGGVTVSAHWGGCGMDRCNCSNGHWVCIAAPRTDNGIVEGVTIYFNNQSELDNYLSKSKHN